MGALQIGFSVCEMFRCFSFLIKIWACEEELMLVSIQCCSGLLSHISMSCLTKSEQSPSKGLPSASCSALKSGKWLMDAVLCSPGLCPGRILDTIQSQEGPVKKQKLRWRCLGWLQTNAGHCTSVWPSHHYRGDCHRCCIFPFSKPAFLLERPEEWNGVILLMLHFERWMRNSGDSEGRAHLLKKETFLSQLLICLVSLLTWEEVVELISVWVEWWRAE